MSDLGFALEAIMNVITECLYKKAFNTKENLLKRLPYILIYIMINLLLIIMLTYIGIKLIESNLILSIITIMLAFLVTCILIYPFVKKIN